MSIDEINEYVAALRTVKGDRPAGKNEKFKTKKALELMRVILKERGHAEPDNDDKDEYRRRTTNKSGATQDLSRIDRFFALRKERSGQIIMVKPEHEQLKTGRKVLDTEHGEKRTARLMLYLTPTMAADIRDWCRVRDISNNEYILELIEADLRDTDKQERIKKLRELMQ